MLSNNDYIVKKSHGHIFDQWSWNTHKANHKCKETSGSHLNIFIVNIQIYTVIMP